MQALLAEYAWDWKAVLRSLQRFIVAHLGDPEAVLVLDETAELKKGTATIGVARQHAGITGQVENCQTVVFAAYVTARAHALLDFRLYLPEQWCAGKARRERAHVPAGATFTTKPALGTQMIAGAGAPFAWAAGDEVYGRSSKLRQACEEAGKGYVLAVPVNFAVTLPSGRKAAVAAVAAMVPPNAWETRSCGRGCKGHRDYAWAWAATVSPRHWVLIRRSLPDPADLAFFCHAPQGRPVSLPALIRIAGKRWPVEECFQQGKGQAGLDQHQVPHLALLPPAHRTVDVRSGPAGRRRSQAGPRQRWHARRQHGRAAAAWNDTGKLPATASDDPPGNDPGLVKVSVPEARRLLNLATTPMRHTQQIPGYQWSRWRRHHQARARFHHYQARLRAAPT